MAELTGKHVLAITLGFFGVIIAVNMVLAVQAVRTFPGLEVANGYVASQTFDADRKAQEALGWTLVQTYEAGKLRLVMTDADGLPAPVKALDVLIGRTTESTNDMTPDFARIAGGFEADVPLAMGKWMLRITAVAPDGTVFRQRLDLFVKG